MLLVVAKDHDLSAVADLVNRAYRGGEAHKGWTTEAAFMGGARADEAGLRADLAAKPGSVILTLRDEDWEKPFGCVWLEPLPGDVWLLGMLAVDPERQDGGTGRALIETCEAYVKARAGQILRMTVIDIRDTLIAWYERRGFHRAGVEPFPYNDRRIGDTTGELRFVVMEKAL
ncbi:MAG: GNAT family N-acetyltransferase [Alphaproteobacteria bacterium]|nr:GNAT family N-acetyltransferase [Alphaproteobacteria bacterium]